MIIQQNNRVDITRIGEEMESTTMEIDSANINKLMDFLSEKIYQDAEGSSVRETVSNAFDSHISINSEEPILVNLVRTDTGTWEFTVEDFGKGLSKDDIENVIKKYLKSTKESCDKQLGNRGLGFKSPMAYTKESPFFFVCRKDGIEVKAMMYKGVDTNRIDYIHEKPTSEVNGVKIIIPIKDSSDTKIFSNKIRQQLCYFKNIYVTDNYREYKNDYKIYQNDLFKFSDNPPERLMHICLDQVYYPIDFKQLGITPINIPIAINVKLTDGIEPIISRENIIYSTYSKDFLKNKIKEIASWFVEKYNTNVQQFETFLEAYPHLGSSTHSIEIEGTTFVINDLEAHSDVSVQEPKVKGLVKRNGNYYKKKADELLYEYSSIAYDERGTWRRQHLSWELNRKAFDGSKIVIFNHSLTGNIKEFLRKKYGTNTLYISKERDRVLSKLASPWGNVLSDTCYIGLLGLKDKDKSKWRGLIQEWQFVRDQLVSNFPDESNLEEGEEYKAFLKDKKERMQELRRQGVKVSGYVSLNKVKGDITVGKLRVKRHDSALTADKTTRKIEELYKTNKLIVYFTKQEFDAESSEIYQYFTAFRNVDFVILNEREIKFVTPHHQYLKKLDFMKSKTFARLSSAILINRLLNKIPENKKNYITQQFPKWEELYDKLRNYKNLHLRNDLPTYIEDIILEQAKELDNYDTNIQSDYLEMEKIFSKFYFLHLLKEDGYYENQQIKKERRKLISTLLLLDKYREGELELVPKVPDEVIESSYKIEEEIFSNVDNLVEEEVFAF